METNKLARKRFRGPGVAPVNKLFPGEEVIRELACIMTHYEIATKFSIDVATARRWLRRSGLPLSGRTPDPDAVPKKRSYKYYDPEYDLTDNLMAKYARLPL